MKKLVIVADDFGALESVNNGIRYLYGKCPTIEISMVTDSEYTKHAVTLINELNIPNIGIHIELLGNRTLGRAVTSQDYINLYKEKSYEEIEELAAEELSVFERLVGRPPTHITSHKGIHGNFKLLGFLIDYAKKHNIPIRKPVTAFNVELSDENYAAEISITRAGIKSTDHLIAHMLGNDTREIESSYLSDLAKVKDGESVEIAIHPGFFDEKLLEYSSLNYQRTRDIAVFSNNAFLTKIKKTLLIKYSN